MKQFNLGNGSALTAGVIMSVNKPAFWTLQRKTQIVWVRFTAYRFVNASGAVVPCKAELILGATDVNFNAKPPGAENLDYAPGAFRAQFSIENDGVFWKSAVLQPGTVLNYNFTLYDYGTAVLPDSYTFDLHIGYEEFDF